MGEPGHVHYPQNAFDFAIADSITVLPWYLLLSPTRTLTSTCGYLRIFALQLMQSAGGYQRIHQLNSRQNAIPVVL